jgi:hypothetical protein
MNRVIAERYYHERLSLPGEPTMADLIEQNLRSASLLRDEESLEAAAIAAMLENCRHGHRCYNAACMLCGVAAQKLFIDTALSMWPFGTSLTHVTIVPTEPQRALGTLRSVDLLWTTNHLKRLLNEAGHEDLRFAAFVDLSHTINLRINHAMMSPHYHMAAATADVLTLTRDFRPVLKPSPHVARPVFCAKLADPHDQLHYMAKPRPTRKTSTVKSVKPLKHWLKPRQQIEALLWLGKHSAVDRIVRGPALSYQAARTKARRDV